MHYVLTGAMWWQRYLLYLDSIPEESLELNLLPREWVAGHLGEQVKQLKFYQEHLEEICQEMKDLYCTAVRKAIKFSRPLWKSNRNIPADNLFTSVELVEKLKEHGLTYLGRMRKNKPQIHHNFNRILIENQKHLFLASLEQPL
ncbi:hypothetical protein LAZ67_18001147 [Cordylochernes scorpioides]|uniref:PiggyBac transposable element-derived protein domain-containing protein n=1 Tax=Cordylochernes scorpioides TaxID=51811 RepID=A0ABY6LFI1_9ARAC|nr:hypothetical protein LAZ67_18001147 [Cordylochernes scorpioides]